MERGRRFDDGEVVRYGAGESWRPTPRGGAGDRSPIRRPRSPARGRDRSRPRSPPLPRPRSPGIPPSDSYVPSRYAPRGRSQSRGRGGGPGMGGAGGGVGGPMVRRERSRGDRDSPPPRRRDRSRSLVRRSPPRRSLSRRGTPRRGTPGPIRGGGGDRFDRLRSPPRRDWERERDRERDFEADRMRDREADRGRDWMRDRDRSREREIDRRDDRRSRSPFLRDTRPPRPPMDRGSPPPLGARVGPFRRSRSRSRRGGDRFQPYARASPRESGISSAVNSQPVSRKPSPGRASSRARSPLPSRDQSPTHRPPFGREASRPGPIETPGRSPPRGPAALRAPPTGPAAGRGYGASLSPAPPMAAKQHPQTPGQLAHRQEMMSPTQPPSGPRGYVPPARGGYPPRGGRGGWNQAPPRHNLGPSPTPSTPSGPSGIPTGPRSASFSAPVPSGTPSQPGHGASNSNGNTNNINNNTMSNITNNTRPFNPPTGPAASHGSGPRQTLAQSLLSTMPPLIPGGKLDPAMQPLITGVSRELEPHTRKLREEEEKLREELYAKQERLRRSLLSWNRLGRESKAWELRSDLSEKSMKNLAGEGTGGAAF